ncbi:hypothetical protein [Devosia naphthalenivorans]|uniref:hypothetical protein n=1 Tax=Devosia naphthalenivorans TaxID=2082392 RepID=UPI000D378E08|nr:hypothetical protein [Devosia naphthalenivorans]
MARTLVGILQILLRQDVTQKAPEINRALASIQGAANRLGSAPWGAAFDRQLDKLKLTPAERAAISSSYGLLARDINGKIAKADLATWRHATLGHFAAVRTGIDEANASARRFHTTVGKMVRMGLITFGGVGGLYMGSRAVHGGATAASEEWRQKAEARYSGLPEEERDALWNQSVKLAGERRLNNALVFQMLREAALAMETTDDAIAVSDAMAQALLYLSNTLGADGAVNGLRGFNRAMDNVQNITPEEYHKSLEAYIRAQQMTGADMDPTAFAEAIKYSRAAGKIFSDEYLFQWLPFRIAEVGGSDAGTQLRAFSDNTIGGTATDKVEDYQTQIGVRNEDGTMAYAAELLQNPERWINERLVPALEAAGVNTKDNVQLAQVLNDVASNRLARDFILSAITNWDQKQRLVENLPRTAGLAAADDIQDVNPFATLDGLVDSLENLSGAAGNHIFPVIIPAMNSLADTINSMAAGIREMPGGAFGLAAGGVGLGLLGAWKVGAGMIALTTAGPSLQTAAVMLQGAATSLGGTGAAAGAAGAASNQGWLAAALTWLKGAGVVAAPAVAAELVTGQPGSMEEYEAQVAEQGRIKTQLWDMVNSVLGTGSAEPPPPLPSPYDDLSPAGADVMPGSPGWGASLDSQFGSGAGPQVDTGQIDAAGTAADTAAGKLQVLNGTLVPKVDTTDLQHALLLANRLSAALQGIGGLMQSQSTSVRDQVNASYADYGVAP